MLKYILIFSNRFKYMILYSIFKKKIVKRNYQNIFYYASITLSFALIKLYTPLH